MTDQTQSRNALPSQGPADTEADKLRRLPNVLDSYARSVEFRMEQGSTVIDSDFAIILRRASKALRDYALRSETAGSRDDALEEAANWCAQQANALHKLGLNEEQRKAFVEAANAIRTMKRSTPTERAGGEYEGTCPHCGGCEEEGCSPHCVTNREGNADISATCPCIFAKQGGGKCLKCMLAAARHQTVRRGK